MLPPPHNTIKEYFTPVLLGLKTVYLAILLMVQKETGLAAGSGDFGWIQISFYVKDLSEAMDKKETNKQTKRHTDKETERLTEI